MVNDQNVMQAVSRILQRSERQEDLQKLVGTFVDVGVLPQLLNQNNQIFYGRRGTGKTHLLRVLASNFQADPKNAVAYIDARTLGSTVQYSDASTPISRRCLALFKDILGEIYQTLLEHIVEVTYNHPNASKALDELDLLQRALLQPTSYVAERAETVVDEASEGVQADLKIQLGTKNGLELGGGNSGSSSQKASTSSSYKVTFEDKIYFPELNQYLSRALQYAEVKLVILLDEWSSLPLDLQPYLAEFLKRGVLPVQRATIKIASLEYRSKFGFLEGDRIVGFELGADIATAPDLDDYYVFDRNPEQITETYADVLFKHLSSELPEGYFAEQYKVNNGSEFVRQLFTERKTFQELARASEGVVRDLINIFTQAFFHSKRQGRDNIDKKAILEASRLWFEQDKSQHLDLQLERVLKRIIDEVIGAKKARSFLLPRSLEHNPIVERLFDARILHLMRRGYADKDNPGTRYNIYSLDYGTYVDLMGTAKQPQIELNLFTDVGGVAGIMVSEEHEIAVPFDDKRSIRRIVLTEHVLRTAPLL